MIRHTLICAVVAALFAPAAAQANITVSGVSAQPASTAAGAHSDFTLSFSLGGSEDVRDVDVDLPPGLVGDANNSPKCSQQQFDSDQCPAQTQVGSQSINANVGVIPGVTLAGTVFNLVPPAGKPAQLGIVVDPGFGLPKQHLRSDVTARPDGGLTSSIKNIPNSTSGVAVHINSISLTLQGKSGATKTGPPFMRNPTSCDAHTTVVHVTGYGSSTDSGQDSFTPTACDALPYSPILSALVGSQGKTAKGSNPPFTTIITQGAGEAGSKQTAVTLPSVLSPNPGSLANVCPQSAYSTDSCPAQSQVGQATAITPLLPTPLSGPVRLVENPGHLPDVVVYLNGLISTRLVGNVTAAPGGGTTTTFSNIPDTPLSSFRLDFFGGSGGLVTAGADLCSTAVVLNGNFLAQSGKTAAPSATAKVNGCARWPTATLSLTKASTSSPTLKLAAQRGVNAKRLRTIEVTLPSSLSLDGSKLKKGVSASKSVKASFPTSHRLLLKARSSAGFTSLTATVSKGALRLSSSLRKHVSKHPKVSIAVKFTELGGRVVTRQKTVTVR